MTRKVHTPLSQELISQIRSALKDADAEDGGVYVYIPHKNGRGSPTPELTEEDKVTIRRMYKRKKATAIELATLYGKSRQTIYLVLREADE